MTIPVYQNNEPGHTQGSETSLEGAQTAMTFASNDRELLLGILQNEPAGLNRDELAAAAAKVGRKIQPAHISSRMLELFKTCQVCYQTNDAGKQVVRKGASGVKQAVYFATHQQPTAPRKLPTRFEAGWDAALMELEKKIYTENSGWLVSPGVVAVLEIMKGMKHHG